MSLDNSHRKFILLGSTLIDRMLEFKKSVKLDQCLRKEFETRRHPMNLNLVEQIDGLQNRISEFVPESDAQAELARICVGILNTSRIFVDEILTFNVIQLYEMQCPRSMMLGFFARSTMRTLAFIEYLTTKTIAGQGCENSDCDCCLQNLREEWSDVQADYNSVKLYLLVTFIQRNESRLPRELVREIITYAQTNYATHCPEIYREALNKLKRGKKVDFPWTISSNHEGLADTT